MKIIDKNIAEQTRGIFPKAESGTPLRGASAWEPNEWRDIPPEKGAAQVLSDEEILELSELVVKIENHYGFPVDIEWARENGRFYIVQSRPITTLSSGAEVVSLADKFLTALGDQELLPPLHNSTFFVQTSGWNTEKYYGRHYVDATSFPLLITMKENEGIMFIPATKAKRLSAEVFTLFWQDEATLTTRLKEYKKQTEIIDRVYKQITALGFLEKEKFVNLVPYAMDIRNATWEMNTLAFFSISFDKEICSQLLKDIGSTLSQERLDAIWERGTTPISDSFEKRREYHILKLLDDKKNWRDIATECQYFGANYNKVSSVIEVEKELKAKFAQWENAEERHVFLEKEERAKETSIAVYKKWFKALSHEEKKLIRYLQTIIELRDVRKDYLAKFLVVLFRIAQQSFRMANLDERLIYLTTFDEIVKGEQYLLKNKNELGKRLAGCTVFVHYDGMFEIETGTFEYTRNILKRFFLDQQKMELNSERIKGQVGFPGKIQGIVKVILNIEKEGGNLNEGDILVTGMTRPEFVPAMKKSAAIITDEGGITCHAAIVSRELKKPCIIGTKIATQVLKDGDLVEVDANEGVVRILERASDVDQTRC